MGVAELRSLLGILLVISPGLIVVFACPLLVRPGVQMGLSALPAPIVISWFRDYVEGKVGHGSRPISGEL